MRQTLLNLHRWAGLVAGVLILILGVTSALLVFENEIDRLLNPRLLTVTPHSKRIPLQLVLKNVRAAFPKEVVTRISLAQKPDHAIQVSLKSGLMAGVDPYSGELLGIRDPEKSLARVILMLHKEFLAGRTGELIVGGVTALTFLMALSGLILWWRFQIFVVKSSRSRRRVIFDLHNVLGLYSAPFLVLITISGLLMVFPKTTYPLILKLNSSPDPPEARSTVVKGAKPLTLDDAVRIADAALPGAATTSVIVPAHGKAVFEVTKRFPEDHRRYGRSRVMIDQYSGQVLQVLSSREAELGTRILSLNHVIHTGDIFGAPTRALALLVCLMLVGQVVTSILIWWKPGKLARTLWVPTSTWPLNKGSEPDRREGGSS